MYAMTGKMMAQAGRRDELATILLRAAQMVGGMPGCHMYAVTEDADDADAVWVLEMWDDQATHDASLQDAGVRALIAEAMPLLAGAPQGNALRVVGGYGVWDN
ncbi:MAG: antibiotic biosynthesis monooxygenase [Anaerolineae bacterium]|nr:antibiotic biosynthesis monooxygenase [Anaerolineae bacterium]